ncbi:MAG: hypothetical protein RLZZ206_4005 [Cyanobacteriota bacterium]
MQPIAGVNSSGVRLANGGRAIPYGLASCMVQPGRAAKDLVAAADTMLDAAKAAGRNRLCVHPGTPVA